MSDRRHETLGLVAYLFTLSVSASFLIAQEARPTSVTDYLTSCEAFGWSGVALVVKEGETLLHKGYGFANVERHQPNGPETLFEIASLAKPFTACAIMALVEDGKIDLDASIAQYLPGVPSDKRPITVRHLLAHSSGMPPTSAGGRGHDLEKAVAVYLSAPLNRTPGESSEYWNGGYALLAGIVQEVSGQSYPEFCRKRLFDVAQLQATGFTGDAQLPINLQAIGYVAGQAVRRASEHPYNSYGWQYQGMGGIVTSSNDLQRFLRAYRAGAILKPETVKLMETNQTEYQGLGWGTTTTKRGTRRIGHGGDVRGFHCQLQRFPDEESHVLLLSNVEEVPMWKLAWNIESLLFDQPLRTPAPPPVRSIPPDKLTIVAGTYQNTDDMHLTVAIVDGKVRLSAKNLGTDPRPEAADSIKRSASAVKLAKKLLAMIQAGEADALRELIGPRIPRSWAQTLCEIVWKKHRETFGELTGIELLDARKSGGADELVLGLQHQEQVHPLRMVLQDDKLLIFDLNAGLPQANTIYAISTDNDLIGFDWSSDKRTSPIAIDFKQGKATALLIERERGQLLRLLRAGG